MEFLLCVVLGFAPGAFWLWFLRGKDDYEPEPWHMVLLVFVIGGMSTMGVLQLIGSKTCSRWVQVSIALSPTRSY